MPENILAGRIQQSENILQIMLEYYQSLGIDLLSLLQNLELTAFKNILDSVLLKWDIIALQFGAKHPDSNLSKVQIKEQWCHLKFQFIDFLYEKLGLLNPSTSPLTNNINNNILSSTKNPINIPTVTPLKPVTPKSVTKNSVVTSHIQKVINSVVKSAKSIGKNQSKSKKLSVQPCSEIEMELIKFFLDLFSDILSKNRHVECIRWEKLMDWAKLTKKMNLLCNLDYQSHKYRSIFKNIVSKCLPNTKSCSFIESLLRIKECADKNLFVLDPTSQPKPAEKPLRAKKTTGKSPTAKNNGKIATPAINFNTSQSPIRANKPNSMDAIINTKLKLDVPNVTSDILMLNYDGNASPQRTELDSTFNLPAPVIDYMADLKMRLKDAICNTQSYKPPNQNQKAPIVSKTQSKIAQPDPSPSSDESTTSSSSSSSSDTDVTIVAVKTLADIKKSIKTIEIPDSPARACDKNTNSMEKNCNQIISNATDEIIPSFLSSENKMVEPTGPSVSETDKKIKKKKSKMENSVIEKVEPPSVAVKKLKEPKNTPTSKVEGEINPKTGENVSANPVGKNDVNNIDNQNNIPLQNKNTPAGKSVQKKARKQKSNMRNSEIDRQNDITLQLIFELEKQINSTSTPKKQSKLKKSNDSLPSASKVRDEPKHDERENIKKVKNESIVTKPCKWIKLEDEIIINSIVIPPHQIITKSTPTKKNSSLNKNSAKEVCQSLPTQTLKAQELTIKQCTKVATPQKPKVKHGGASIRKSTKKLKNLHLKKQNKEKRKAKKNDQLVKKLEAIVNSSAFDKLTQGGWGELDPNAPTTSGWNPDPCTQVASVTKKPSHFLHGTNFSSLPPEYTTGFNCNKLSSAIDIAPKNVATTNLKMDNNNEIQNNVTNNVLFDKTVSCANNGWGDLSRNANISLSNPWVPKNKGALFLTPNNFGNIVKTSKIELLTKNVDSKKNKKDNNAVITESENTIPSSRSEKPQEGWGELSNNVNLSFTNPWAPKSKGALLPIPTMPLIPPKNNLTPQFTKTSAIKEPNFSNDMKISYIGIAPKNIINSNNKKTDILNASENTILSSQSNNPQNGGWGDLSHNVNLSFSNPWASKNKGALLPTPTMPLIPPKNNVNNSEPQLLNHCILNEESNYINKNNISPNTHIGWGELCSIPNTLSNYPNPWAPSNENGNQDVFNTDVVQTKKYNIPTASNDDDNIWKISKFEPLIENKKCASIRSDSPRASKKGKKKRTSTSSGRPPVVKHFSESSLLPSYAGVKRKHQSSSPSKKTTPTSNSRRKAPAGFSESSLLPSYSSVQRKYHSSPKKTPTRNSTRAKTDLSKSKGAPAGFSESSLLPSYAGVKRKHQFSPKKTSTKNSTRAHPDPVKSKAAPAGFSKSTSLLSCSDVDRKHQSSPRKNLAPGDNIKKPAQSLFAMANSQLYYYYQQPGLYDRTSEFYGQQQNIYKYQAPSLFQNREMAFYQNGVGNENRAPNYFYNSNVRTLYMNPSQYTINNMHHYYNGMFHNQYY